MKNIFIFYFIFISFCVRGQIITTYAGGGDNGVGDSLHARCGNIVDPGRIAFDKYGNLYVASCFGGNRIRMIDTAGIMVTVAGTGDAGDDGDNGLAIHAKLNSPTAVAIDTLNNLYIAESQNGTIRKVDALTGIITTIAGTGISGYNYDSVLATSAMLNLPEDLCFDKKGNLYIADGGNNRIRKVATNGIITTVAGNGIYGFSGDGGLAIHAQLWEPGGVTTDSIGNLYICDYGNYRIRKVDTFGIITTIAGNGTYTYNTDNIPAISASFSPAGLCFDNYKNLYIECYDENRVLMVDTDGVIHNIAGNGSTGKAIDGVLATSSPVFYPGGLAFDSCGNLYISEIGNARVRKVIFNTSCNGINTTCTAADTGITDTTKTMVRILNNNAEISVFPNPANDVLNIGNITNGMTYQLVNMVGDVVKEGVLTAGNNKVTIVGLADGVYLLEVSGEEERIMRRVIKQ